MAAIFKVAFSYVHPKDRPEPVTSDAHDNDKTVAARDVEDAIAKVRKAVSRERYEEVDDDGNPTGKFLKGQEIVVHYVDFVSGVDLA